MNKKLIFGLGSAFASIAGALWLKEKLPLEPKIPVVSDDTVLLFQFPYSPFCLKVAKIMDYKGIPYKTVNLLPMVHSSFVKKLSGQNLVPVIKHKGKVVCDSTFIAKYLEELVPEPSIYLENEEENQEVLLMEDWGDESFEAPLANLATIYLYEHPEIVLEDSSIDTGFELIDNNKEKIAPMLAKQMLKKDGVNPAKKDILKKRARESLNILAAKIQKNDYLVGDKLTIADITIASHLSIAERIPYIYEDDVYSELFKWQKDIFNQTKRRQASLSR